MVGLIKSNYRPTSILQKLCKIFEKCIYNQLPVFFDKVFSKYRCGFRKGFSAKHCLIKLLKQWKKSIDQGLAFGAILTDLSKAFNCLSDKLLVSKLSAYGIDDSAVRFISIIFQTRNKGQKLATTIVLREMFFLAYLKDQF